jgi:hypothetical protein
LLQGKYNENGVDEVCGETCHIQDWGHLGSDAMKTARWIPMLQRNISLHIQGAFKTEAVHVYSSPALVTMYQNTRRHFAEVRNLNIHSRNNFKLLLVSKKNVISYTFMHQIYMISALVQFECESNINARGII